MLKLEKVGFWNRASAFVKLMIFPQKCIKCNAIFKRKFESDAFCDACTSDFLSSVREVCGRCGEGMSVCGCVPDALADAGIDSACTCFSYDKTKRDSAASRLIYSLKSCKSAAAVGFSARLLASRLEKAALTDGIDLSAYTVTYAPRRNRAVRENGGDHMAKTAKMTAKLLGLSFDPMLENTASKAQKEKDASSRLDAAFGSVRLKKRTHGRLEGKRYILLDDILTSGATLAASATALLDGGADDVLVCTLAKTKSR